MSSSHTTTNGSTTNGSTTNGSTTKGSTADTIVPLIINGKEETTANFHPVINPSTSRKQWSFAAASPSDATRAADSAFAAYPSWRATAPATRRDIFLRAADLLSERSGEYASYMEEETGALPNFSSGLNLPTTVAMLRDIAGRIVDVLSSGRLPVCAEHDARSAMVRPEPYGVVLGIAPWNAPFILGMRAVAYALAAGNTVVLKGSELSPRCHWAVARVLVDAGVRPGALNLVFHRPQDAAQVTRALVEHRAVRKINFTGSTAVGRIIAEMAGRCLKPCLMELGGKNCAVVLGDAELEAAAKKCVLGAFYHSGQICMSTDLILAERSIVDKLKAHISEAASTLFPTDKPSSILVTPAGVKKNKDIISNAIEKGASVFHGDADMQHESDTRLRPLILEGVKEGMDMFDKEAFGPTAAIIPIDNENEAIEIINNNDYGLSSSIFTKDLARAFRVAKQIESGYFILLNRTRYIAS